MLHSLLHETNLLVNYPESRIQPAVYFCKQKITEINSEKSMITIRHEIFSQIILFDKYIDKNNTNGSP